MSITAAQYERISRFLNAAMDTEAMEAFEAELLAYPAMRQQLDFELMVRDGLALKKTSVIQPSIAPVTDTPTAAGTTQNTPGKKSRLRRLWIGTGIAASIVLAVSVFLLFKQPAKKNTALTNTPAKDTAAATTVAPATITRAADSSKANNGAALFAKFYTKDKIPDSYPVFLADALTRYEAGDYKAMQQLNLADIPATRGSNAAEEKEQVLQLGHYYKGICWLQTGSTEKAIPHFNWVIKNSSAHALSAKAAWCLALAYVKNNETEKAVETIKSIIAKNPNNAITQKAKALLAALQNKQ